MAILLGKFWLNSSTCSYCGSSSAHIPPVSMSPSISSYVKVPSKQEQWIFYLEKNENFGFQTNKKNLLNCYSEKICYSISNFDNFQWQGIRCDCVKTLGILIGWFKNELRIPLQWSYLIAISLLHFQKPLPCSCCLFQFCVI